MSLSISTKMIKSKIEQLLKTTNRKVKATSRRVTTSTLRRHDKRKSFRNIFTHLNAISEKVGEMILFFGCRTKNQDIYRAEKKEMIAEGVLTESYLALSRDPSTKKVFTLYYYS